MLSSAGEPRSAHVSLPTLFLNSDLMMQTASIVRAACLPCLMCAAVAAASLALSCTA